MIRYAGRVRILPAGVSLILAAGVLAGCSNEHDVAAEEQTTAQACAIVDEVIAPRESEFDRISNDVVSTGEYRMARTNLLAVNEAVWAAQQDITNGYVGDYVVVLWDSVRSFSVIFDRAEDGDQTFLSTHTSTIAAAEALVTSDFAALREFCAGEDPAPG